MMNVDDRPEALLAMEWWKVHVDPKVSITATPEIGPEPRDSGREVQP